VNVLKRKCDTSWELHVPCCAHRDHRHVIFYASSSFFRHFFVTSPICSSCCFGLRSWKFPPDRFKCSRGVVRDSVLVTLDMFFGGDTKSMSEREKRGFGTVCHTTVVSHSLARRFLGFAIGVGLAQDRAGSPSVHSQSVLQTRRYVESLIQPSRSKFHAAHKTKGVRLPVGNQGRAARRICQWGIIVQRELSWFFQ